MEKNTAALTGAFVHVYLKVFSFLQNFFPEDGGHLPGEREHLEIGWVIELRALVGL